MFLLTKGYVGLHSDSVAYLSAAENIVAGRGLTIYRLFENATPLASFPPLYPFLLAPLRNFPLVGIFILNFVSFLFLSYSVYKIAKTLLGEASRGKILLLYGLVIFGAPIIYSYSMALTEPIFLGVVFFLLSMVVEGDIRGRRLLYITLLSSLLPLLRYAGVFLWLFVGGLLLVQKNTIATKLKQIAVFSVSVLPLLFWFIYLRSQGEVSRRLVSEPLTFDFVIDATKTVTQWVVPLSAVGMLLGGVLFAFGVYLFIFMANNRKRSTFVVIWFAAAYVIFIIASYVLFDRAISADFQRILVPLYPTVILLIGSILFSAQKKWLMSIGVFIFVSSLVLVHVGANAKLVQNGPPLNFEAWRGNRLLELVRKEQSSYHFISNAWEPLYVYGGVYVDRIPVKGQEGRAKEQEYFRKALAKEKPLVFVFSKEHPKANYLANPDSLSGYYSLTLLKEFPEGGVYLVQEKTETP